VVADKGDLTQEVAHERYTRSPPQGADEAVREESPAVHPADACDSCDEGAHHRHEAGQDDRFAAMLLEEGMRLVEVLALEQASPTGVQRSTDRPTDLVAHDVAQERGGGQDRAGDDDVDVQIDPEGVALDRQADREQQRVAGHEEDEQSALDEDHRQADPEGGRPQLRQ